jgi:pimeloyl-ACP methyl ester carboxylesterase
MPSAKALKRDRRPLESVVERSRRRSDSTRSRVGVAVSFGPTTSDFCLKYPKPDFSLDLRPPYNGPFPDVPVLMLNGDIDLQTPLEMAGRAKRNWPNSVFLTIKDATHVTLQTSECSVVTALSFLENLVLPDPHTCD